MSTEPDPRVVVKFADSIDDERLADAVGAFRERFPQLSLDQEFPSLTRSAFEVLKAGVNVVRSALPRRIRQGTLTLRLVADNLKGGTQSVSARVTRPAATRRR